MHTSQSTNNSFVHLRFISTLEAASCDALGEVEAKQSGEAMISSLV